MATGGGARRGAGELEGEVLAVLHAADAPLTPADVQRALDSGLAYTTVMTILGRLHGKGLARRLPAGRGYAYCPVESEAQSVARRMHSLLGVGSDPAAVLAQFVDELAPDEGAILEQLLDRRNQPGQ